MVLSEPTLFDAKGRCRGDRQVSLILDLEGRRNVEKKIVLRATDTIDDVKAKAAWRFDIDRNAALGGNMFQILGKAVNKGKGKGRSWTRAQQVTMTRFKYLEDGLRLSDYNVGHDSLLTWTDANELGDLEFFDP